MCGSSLVTLDMGDRTPNIARPGDKRGNIYIFTAANGDIIVTGTTSCDCFMNVEGANGNSINIGPNYDVANASAQTASCPANLQAQNLPTTTSALSPFPQLSSCHSWVIPATQVKAAAALSNVPNTVVITIHFEVNCYSACGTTTIASQTNVISSGPVADVRCEIQPMRGMVYRIPAQCANSTVPPPFPAPTPVPPPPSNFTPPPPIPPPARPSINLTNLIDPSLLPEEFKVVLRVPGVILEGVDPVPYDADEPPAYVFYEDPDNPGFFFPGVPDPYDPNLITPGDPASPDPPTFFIEQLPNGTFVLLANPNVSLTTPPPSPSPPPRPPPRRPPPHPLPPPKQPPPPKMSSPPPRPPHPPPQVAAGCRAGAGGWPGHCSTCAAGTTCMQSLGSCSAVQVSHYSSALP
jgi:hypothetical protein